MLIQWLLFTWEFGRDNWLMYKLLWPDPRSQHPPSAHLPSLFHLSHEKVREYLQSPAISTHCFKIEQLVVCFAGYRGASYREIHVNGLEFQKTKLLFLLLRQWRNGLVWVLMALLLNISILSKKARTRESLGENRAECVCSHSTCLTYDSALCLQRSAMI